LCCLLHVLSVRLLAKQAAHHIEKPFHRLIPFVESSFSILDAQCPLSASHILYQRQATT
jgi:hypothetical protein